jgi:hypothetical protein
MTPEIRTYIDKDGKTQATFAESEKPEDEICDFCLGKERPYTVFTAKQFVIWPCVFEPEWNACPKCAAFINANDREGLLNRSSANSAAFPKEREGVKMVQDKFFENKQPERE